MAVNAVSIIPLHGLPLIRAGDDLLGLIVAALERNGERLANGDVLVVTHAGAKAPRV